jgi:hypothetical protein
VQELEPVPQVPRAWARVSARAWAQVSVRAWARVSAPEVEAAVELPTAQKRAAVPMRFPERPKPPAERWAPLLRRRPRSLQARPMQRARVPQQWAQAQQERRVAPVPQQSAAAVRALRAVFDLPALDRARLRRSMRRQRTSPRCVGRVHCLGSSRLWLPQPSWRLCRSQPLCWRPSSDHPWQCPCYRLSLQRWQSLSLLRPWSLVRGCGRMSAPGLHRRRCPAAQMDRTSLAAVRTTQRPEPTSLTRWRAQRRPEPNWGARE